MMKKSMKERGQGLVEYALILFLVAVVVIAVLVVITEPRRMFTEDIDAGTIQISGTQIALGQSGHPQPVNPEIKVVNDLLGPVNLEDYPQKYVVTGCSNIYLSETDTVVLAATPVDEEVARLIDVQAPAKSGGYVQVCVPEGLSDVPVYLWSQQVNP